MLESKLDGNYFRKYTWTHKVGSGAYSKVFAISKEHVIKIKRVFATSDFENELNIQKQAFDMGFNVSNPKGIYYLNINYFGNGFGLFDETGYEGFVMQRLYGIKGTKLKGDVKRKVKDIAWEQLDRFKEKGFKPSEDGCALQNTIYNRGLDIVFFVDFGGWSLA